MIHSHHESQQKHFIGNHEYTLNETKRKQTTENAENLKQKDAGTVKLSARQQIYKTRIVIYQFKVIRSTR